MSQQQVKHGGDNWGTYSGEFPFITDNGRLIGRNVKIIITAHSGELCTFLNNKKVIEVIYARERSVNENISLESRDIKDHKNVLVIVEKVKKGTEEEEFRRAIANLMKGGARLNKDV